MSIIAPGEQQQSLFLVYAKFKRKIGGNYWFHSMREGNTLVKIETGLDKEKGGEQR